MTDYNPNQFDDGPSYMDQLRKDTTAVKRAVDYGRVNPIVNHPAPGVGSVEVSYEIRRGDNDPTQVLKGLVNVNDSEVIAEYLSEVQGCAWYVVETKTTVSTVAKFGV